MSNDKVGKIESNKSFGTLTSSPSTSSKDKPQTEAKKHPNNLFVLDRKTKASQSMPLLSRSRNERKLVDNKNLNAVSLDNAELELIEAMISFNLLLANIISRKKAKKEKRSIITKTLFCIIVLGVSIGEATPVYYFISNDKNLKKLDSKLLLILAILATAAALILSLALFSQAMIETADNSGKILKIIRHGQSQDKEGNIKEYAKWQRGAIIFAFILSIFSAFAVGALAYNSLTEAFPNVPGIKGIGIAVLIFAVIATSAVNNFYFVNTLLAIFKKDKTNSLKGTAKVIVNWFPNTSKRIAGLDSEQKLKEASFGNKVKVAAFWLLLIGLCAGTTYIIYGLFSKQLMGMDLSFISISYGPAIACTIIAMTVLCVFRFKSLYQLFNYLFHKETRQEKSPNYRSINRKQSICKNVGFVLLNILIFTGCFTAPVLNSFGQGLGASSVSGLLPIVILGAIGLSLASFSANRFAVIDVIDEFFEHPEQPNKSDQEKLNQGQSDRNNLNQDAFNLSQVELTISSSNNKPVENLTRGNFDSNLKLSS